MRTDENGSPQRKMRLDRKGGRGAGCACAQGTRQIHSCYPVAEILVTTWKGQNVYRKGSVGVYFFLFYVFEGGSTRGGLEIVHFNWLDEIHRRIEVLWSSCILPQNLLLVMSRYSLDKWAYKAPAIFCLSRLPANFLVVTDHYSNNLLFLPSSNC